MDQFVSNATLHLCWIMSHVHSHVHRVILSTQTINVNCALLSVYSAMKQGVSAAVTLHYSCHNKFVLVPVLNPCMKVNLLKFVNLAKVHANPALRPHQTV